jgi:hypothetical protein
MNHIALTAALLLVAGTQLQAAETPWVPVAGFQQHVSTKLNGGKVIPTGIACRARNGNLQIQLAYQPLSSMKKPFHKWQWVVDRADLMPERIANLKLSDRPDLKYRVVMQETVSLRGAAWVCAVAFR